MNVTTEEAERLALILNRLDMDLNAAALRSLAADRDALRQERDGLDALIKRMHEQDVRAIKAWQAAHPGSELTWPSSARLSAWCMGEVASVTAERDALRAENARLRKLVAYLAGTNTDHVQVALAGNPIVCDAIHAEARAALGETQ
jgi:hypothetical protein